MSSTLATTDPNDQATATGDNVSASSSQEIRHLSAISTPIAVLPDQILTEEEQEDILIQQINELTRSFLRLPNRRYPYRELFRWTLDGDPNADFSVIMLISEPADLI